jgi:hypothetical protein
MHDPVRSEVRCMNLCSIFWFEFRIKTFIYEVSNEELMKLYVKFYFASEGSSPLDTIRVMRKLGFVPEVGDYDMLIKFDDPEEYTKIVEKLHETLKGMKVWYTLTTKKE